MARLGDRPVVLFGHSLGAVVAFETARRLQGGAAAPRRRHGRVPGTGTGAAAAVHRATEAVHTNHFLHPPFASLDELNVFARNSSVRRLQACDQMLTEIDAGAGPEERLARLSEPPINVRASGDIRRERTVAAVVLRPAHGELHLRPGDPSASTTRVFGAGRTAMAR